VPTGFLRRFAHKGADALLFRSVFNLQALQKAFHGRACNAVDYEGVRGEVAQFAGRKWSFGLDVERR